MAAQVQPIGIREIVFESLSPASLTLASSASATAFAIAQLAGWPLWGVTMATVAPWLPLVAQQTRWIASLSAPLALFYALAIIQSGHFSEHLAQMVQIHVLKLHGHQAMGLISPLNMEWVHLGWNTLAVAGVALLLCWFRDNGCLWLSLAIAAWHEIEHLYIISAYLSTGVEGTPGLLATGGALGGGLPLSRPDLHFLYNLVETLPILLAFVLQVRRMRQAGPRDERGAA